MSSMTVLDRIKRINHDLSVINQRLNGVIYSHSHEVVRKDERYLLTNDGLDKVSALQHKASDKMHLMMNQVNQVIQSHSQCYIDDKKNDANSKGV